MDRGDPPRASPRRRWRLPSRTGIGETRHGPPRGAGGDLPFSRGAAVAGAKTRRPGRPEGGPGPLTSESSPDQEAKLATASPSFG